MGIVYLLSSEFTKIVLLAILLAMPISYVMATSWLADFAFKIDLAWWYFVSAGLSALFIAWLTVSIQAVRAARMRAVNSLRAE